MAQEAKKVERMENMSWLKSNRRRETLQRAMCILNYHFGAVTAETGSTEKQPTIASLAPRRLNSPESSKKSPCPLRRWLGFLSFIREGKR